MELAEALRRRRMVRDFQDRPVSAADRDRLLASAVRAPSAGFSQGVSVLALTEPARFWELAAGERTSQWLAGMRRAPLLIMVCTAEQTYRSRYAEPDKGRDESAAWPVPWWWVDAGAAIENILLRIVDLDLAGCLFGLPDGREQQIRACFGIPEDQSLVAMIAVGYPATDQVSAGSATRRARRDDLVHIDRWRT